MPEVKITTKEDGTSELSTLSHIEVSHVYKCLCDAKYTITLQLPEGVEFNGQISLNANCPVCGRQIILPHGHHYIENGQLLTK